jgi:hypothetical protein
MSWHFLKNQRICNCVVYSNEKQTNILIKLLYNSKHLINFVSQFLPPCTMTEILEGPETVSWIKNPGPNIIISFFPQPHWNLSQKMKYNRRSSKQTNEDFEDDSDSSVLCEIQYMEMVDKNLESWMNRLRFTLVTILTKFSSDFLNLLWTIKFLHEKVKSFEMEEKVKILQKATMKSKIDRQRQNFLLLYLSTFFHQIVWSGERKKV